ncbi:TIGR03617 family F420-dependent LLM class oxidoreductase [Nonomuraea sp. K274]|uniref:TIGR03617 family F420-dependent LLM class oxidoreductase n=1 Tax=Nonomuraea cypriaca TaxID=1187855 RepID=A0A931EZB2_9ACTN|nr:TIGR03617 family F420-dependent LLM class oxidoreductase [Nonomuraea cypriaca]MBF8185003.1 TIGR03617 family F420-dependent LLM class oxidoreductase [Nonomuraea cypriaca]
MRVEVSLRDVPLGDVPELAARLEQAGVDTVCDAEVTRDPLLTLMAVASATSRVELATAVTIAFPRSPMVLATQARMLADHSGGRFRLGLGTQVRRHIEERFSTAWDSPGPRMRDYVSALRAIWRAWETGGELRHEGPFYRHTLMTPEFRPASDHAPIPVDLAAVNRYNLTTAASLCDGVRLHPFSTRAYVSDVALPTITGAARTSGEVRVTGGGFVATGATAEDVRAAREHVRRRVGFYGSTRSYLPVLAHHGLDDLGEELQRTVREGRWDELASKVDDEVLELFCAVAPYEGIGAAVGERFGGLVDAVQLPAPRGDTDWRSFARAVADIQALG